MTRVRRAMWKCFLVGGGLLLVICVAFLDVQMRLGDEVSPWNASSIRRTLMQRPETRAWWMESDGFSMRGRPKNSVEDLGEFFGDGNRYREEDMEAPMRRLPGAIIIGVKKGGTRALLEILRLHPEVAAPGPEIHFFDRHYDKGFHWYRQQMPSSLEGQLTVEKTPGYLIAPGVPRRVANMSRELLLLLVVRDPVTRALSDYAQASSKRPQDTRSFEDMAFRNASTGLVDPDWTAIRIGQYAKHLERWTKYFPLNQIHVVSGERLVEDPVSELQAVQKFLGISPVIGAQHFFFNQSKGFPCLRKSPRSEVPRCLGKTKGRSHPRVAQATLQRLRDFFRPFNQKFYRIVGRDFGWP